MWMDGIIFFFFFFQAEDGIRDLTVTGVQTCALPISLPIAATIDLLPEIARHARADALVTDACSTKVRITQAAAAHLSKENGPVFLGGHPMAGRELSGIAPAAASPFRGNTYALLCGASR